MSQYRIFSDSLQNFNSILMYFDHSFYQSNQRAKNARGYKTFNFVFLNWHVYVYLSKLQSNLKWILHTQYTSLKF